MRAERSLMFWRQLAAMRAEPFAAVPDAELLSRYTASRDEAAFEELARRHGGMVWAVCRQLLPDPADAEDAFQAVFLAFVKSSGRVRNGNVGAWLHGTAVRGAMKLRRGAVRARQRDRATAKPEAASPPGDWNELLAAVHDEVGRLPEALRTAFVVCDLEGVPQPDAAARLGWKAGTLTGRLSKARKRLLGALTKRGLAPAATLGLLGLSAATTSADVPLKLLVTVLNFPSAAPGTIPATLAALSLEIVPMTLSKVKLLALAAMLTCGLAAGTGTVLMQVADAQGPGAGGRPTGMMPPGASAAPPLATPSAEPKPRPSAEVEYKYIPREFGEAGTTLVQRPFQETVKLITEQSRGGWEFAGTFNSKVTAREFERLAKGEYKLNMPQDATIDCTILVFKKPRTPGKSVPAGGAGGEGGGNDLAGMGGMPGGMSGPGGPGMPAFGYYPGSAGAPPGGPGGGSPPGVGAAVGGGGGMSGLAPTVRAEAASGLPKGGPGGLGYPGGPGAVAESEPVVITLKGLDAEAVMALCERLLPKPAEVIFIKKNSLVILNAKSADIAKLKKVLDVLDGQPSAPRLYDRVPPADVPTLGQPRIAPQVPAPGETRLDPQPPSLPLVPVRP